MGGFILRIRNNEEKEIHYHAGFLVYIDGKLQDFSDTKYMDIEPCKIASEKKEHGNDQREKAHLHDGIGDVVHVQREGAVWSDLFKNIEYSFPKSKQIQGFINGLPVEDILAHPINAYDSVIIVVGDSKNIDINHYVSKEHIKEIEKKSETCGT